MAVYQCARCAKKYIDDRDSALLCPFCHCRVIEYRGRPPLNISRAPLLATRGAAEPEPLIPEFRYELIPLTAKNTDFWRKYAAAMRLVALRSHFDGTMKGGYTNAVKGFMDALDIAGTGPNVWIAVGSHGEVLPGQFAETACRIEICMTVTAQENIPFTTHMGIFRTPLRRLSPVDFEAVRQEKLFDLSSIIRRLEYSVNRTRATPNIACQLHAFAAERCLRICRGVPKKYMITAPLQKMMEIIEEAFPSATTRNVSLVSGKKPLVLRVGNDSLDLGILSLDHCRWTQKLTDIDGDRPKLAVPLEKLAAALDEHARVAAILNWLEKKR